MIATIEAIQQLRTITHAGILDCRRALEQANGDLEQAVEVLRAQGLENLMGREERPVTQGLIALYTHGEGRAGVMVEVNTETDFASRSAVVRKLAHELTLQVAAAAPRFVSEADIPAEVLQAEAQEAAGKARRAGKPEAIVERVVAGTLQKFKRETVLLNQAYIRDEQMTVAQLLNQAALQTGEKIAVRRFVRWEVGETAGEE